MTGPRKPPKVPMVLTSASPPAAAGPRAKDDTRLWNGPMPERPPAIARLRATRTIR